MKATILLKTNPGVQEKAYSVVKDIPSVRGVKTLDICHYFGQFDGSVVCEYEDLKALNEFTEQLRKEGVFYTETLIAIE